MVTEDQKFKIAWACLIFGLLFAGIPAYLYFQDFKAALGAFVLVGLCGGGFTVTAIEVWPRIRKYFI